MGETLKVDTIEQYNGLFAGITLFTPKECSHLRDWFD